MAAVPQASPEAIWEEARRKAERFAYEEALTLIEDLPPAVAGERRTRLLRAASRLYAQPFSQTTVRTVASELEQLRTEHANDETGIYACYLRGRIAQVFDDAGGADEAIRWYRTLAEEHPRHPLATLAWVKISLLKSLTAENLETFLEVHAEMETRRDMVEAGPFAGDYHYVLGIACLRQDAPLPMAFDHLEAAMSFGVRAVDVRANLLVSLGEVAIALGRRGLATEVLGKFVREFPQDKRTYTVRMTVAVLRGEAPADTPPLLDIYPRPGRPASASDGE